MKSCKVHVVLFYKPYCVFQKMACLAFAEGYLQLAYTVYIALGHAFDRPIDLRHLMRDIYQSTVTALFI